MLVARAWGWWDGRHGPGSSHIPAGAVYARPLGGVAQRLEQASYTRHVGGSNPPSPTTSAVGLRRAPNRSGHAREQHAGGSRRVDRVGRAGGQVGREDRLRACGSARSCPGSAGGPVPRSFCRTQSQASGYSKPLRPPGGARRAGASRAGARRALAVGTRAAPASRSPHAESDDAIALLDDRARSQRGNDPPPPSASTDEAEQERADEDAKARVGSLVHRDLLPVTGPGVSLRQTVKCVW